MLDIKLEKFVKKTPYQISLKGIEKICKKNTLSNFIKRYRKNIISNEKLYL